MKNAVCALVLLVLVAVVGCGGHEAAGHAGHTDHVGHAAGDVAVALTHGLNLDGTEKWVMDEHTRAVFGKMAGRLPGVGDADATSSEWKQLAASLNEDITELIQGCTMQGAAHDELHKFLMFYMPAVDALAASGATEDAARVRGLLKTYAEYFE